MCDLGDQKEKGYECASTSRPRPAAGGAAAATEGLPSAVGAASRRQ